MKGAKPVFNSNLQSSSPDGLIMAGSVVGMLYAWPWSYVRECFLACVPILNPSVDSDAQGLAGAAQEDES